MVNNCSIISVIIGGFVYVYMVIVFRDIFLLVYMRVKNFKFYERSMDIKNVSNFVN